MDKLVQIMGDVISRRHDDWEDTLLEVSEQVGIAFDELRNESQDIEVLRLPR